MDHEEKRKTVYEWRRCEEKSCRRRFYISIAEKEYFDQKGFELPKRCYPCRVRRREHKDHNHETQS